MSEESRKNETTIDQLRAEMAAYSADRNEPLEAFESVRTAAQSIVAQASGLSAIQETVAQVAGLSAIQEAVAQASGISAIREVVAQHSAARSSALNALQTDVFRTAVENIRASNLETFQAPRVNFTKPLVEALATHRAVQSDMLAQITAITRPVVEAQEIFAMRAAPFAAVSQTIRDAFPFHDLTAVGSATKWLTESGISPELKASTSAVEFLAERNARLAGIDVEAIVETANRLDAVDVSEADPDDLHVKSDAIEASDVDGESYLRLALQYLQIDDRDLGADAVYGFVFLFVFSHIANLILRFPQGAATLTLLVGTPGLALAHGLASAARRAYVTTQGE